MSQGVWISTTMAGRVCIDGVRACFATEKEYSIWPQSGENWWIVKGKRMAMDDGDKIDGGG